MDIFAHQYIFSVVPDILDMPKYLYTYFINVHCIYIHMISLLILILINKFCKWFGIVNRPYTGLRLKLSGTVGQWVVVPPYSSKVPGLIGFLSLGYWYTEFLCMFCLCMHWFPPTCKNIQVLWIGVHEFVIMVFHLPCSQCSSHRLWLYCDPDQDKVVAEDDWMKSLIWI